jgi:heat shock protein HtpX
MVIDSDVANAVVAGNAPAGATLIVTRGLLERLDRAQIESVAAHCVAAIGNGDQRIMQSLLATFLTLGLFHTILDLPFRASAWSALGRFARATLDRRVAPAQVDAAARGIEQSFASESLGPLSPLMVPLLPFHFVMLFQRLVLMMWCGLVVRWPLTLMWRARRYLADSTAVQLCRDPDALAAVLIRIAPHAGIPAGAERRDYLFMWGVGRGRGALDRYGITLPLHPRIDRRLKRLAAIGAASPPTPADAPSRLRLTIGFALWCLIMSPFLLIGVLAVLGLVGAILWISLFTVLISLLLGLGFLALVFGR